MINLTVKLLRELSDIGKKDLKERLSKGSAIKPGSKSRRECAEAIINNETIQRLYAEMGDIRAMIPIRFIFNNGNIERVDELERSKVLQKIQEMADDLQEAIVADFERNSK